MGRGTGPGHSGQVPGLSYFYCKTSNALTRGPTPYVYPGKYLARLHAEYKLPAVAVPFCIPVAANLSDVPVLGPIDGPQFAPVQRWIRKVQVRFYQEAKRWRLNGADKKGNPAKFALARGTTGALTWGVVVMQSRNTTYCQTFQSGGPQRSQRGTVSFLSIADTKLCPTRGPRDRRTSLGAAGGSAKTVCVPVSFEVRSSEKRLSEVGRFLPAGQGLNREPRRIRHTRQRWRPSHNRKRGRTKSPIAKLALRYRNRPVSKSA